MKFCLPDEKCDGHLMSTLRIRLYVSLCDSVSKGGFPAKNS